MEPPFKTYEFSDGRTLELHHDKYPESPRSWDNLGTMVCHHGSYCLGDKQDGHGYFYEDFNGWDALETQIQEDNPDCVILPLYLFDHSGITMSTTSEQFRACDSMAWDWGQVGFIFVSRAKINKEYGDHGGRTDEQIEEYLCNEVKVYDQYLTGDICGFIMRDKPCETCDGPGEEMEDSGFWGFFGSDPIENGIVDHLDEKYREELKELV